MKTLLITVTDQTHELIEQIKAEKGLKNNADMLEFVLKEAVKK